jgi:hypothetical protein
VAVETRAGQRVRVRIGEYEREAIESDGSFAVEHGQMAFAPGSSGWKNKEGQETRWMELFLRGGNASAAFNHPPIGARIEMK